MGEKWSKLKTKTVSWTRADWSGLLAFTSLVGLLVSVLVDSSEGMKLFAMLASMSFGYYFGRRGR